MIDTTFGTKRKTTQVLAVAKSSYKNVIIWETEEGVTVFVGGKQYDFVTLGDCTAFIDSCYSSIVN